MKLQVVNASKEMWKLETRIASKLHVRPMEGGFTLAEVMVSFAIVAMAFLGILKAYAFSMERAEWSAHSLAAQSLASQQVEALRAAKWEPLAWPAIDEMGITNYARIETLDIPEGGSPTSATNVIAVTMASENPPVRQIRVDCVWSFPGRGVYTNTVITLRAPDQ